MKALTPALAAALTLGLAGCNPPAERSSTAAADAIAPPAAAVTPAAADGMTLQGDGLVFPAANGAPARTLKIGAPEAEAVAALTALRGTAPARETNSECGAGPIDFLDGGEGLDLLIQNGRFEGWHVGSNAAVTLATASGIHAGSTLAQLRAADPVVTLDEDTLGVEFSAGGVEGFLDGRDPGSKVTGLWSGLSCFFR